MVVYLHQLRTKNNYEMNIYELDRLIEAVKNDKDLFEFYTRKRKELVKQININVKEALKNL